MAAATGRAERVREVFSAALDQPTAMRPEFVRQACADDTAVFREVIELVALHEQMAACEAPDELVGKRLGAYEVVRQLGAGGMGRVYLARRADGTFQREVAIKIVDIDADAAPDLLERFQEERRILASLAHPNIAALLDAGQASARRMYFIMEYVDGRPITQSCNQRELGLRARIEVFLGVCEAVSFAHRNLVVHRDLKPGNILVDVHGQPKLLDFGIAKALTRAYIDPDPTDPSMKRATFAYASPEHGGPAHTSMDVYALGVILHELLTGTRPAPANAAADATVIIPRAASEALSHRLASQAGLSRRLGSIQPRDLAGDLDAIVATAIHRDHRQRHRSVDALADDLRAWLTDRPVLARAGGALYRVRKFTRRNAAVTAAASLAVVALLIAVGVLARLWTVTRAERDRAGRQVDAARLLADSMLSLDEKLAGLNGTTTARGVLVEAIASYLPAAELSTDRQLLLETARAYRRLGDVDGNPNGPNLGNPARALDHYARAIAVLDRLRSQAPDDDVELAVAQTLTSRGDVETAQHQYDRASGSYDQALALVTQLSARHPGDPRYQELAAGIHRPRGDVRLARGDVSGAVEEFERALALDEATAARFPGRPELKRRHALTQIRLGDARARAGALEAARTHYESAFGMLNTLAGESWNRRNLLRDAALGLARLGTLRAQSEEGGGQSDVLNAISMLRDLNRSDPSDARARRDLMVALTQYGDVPGLDSAARHDALNEALQIARQAIADAPGDTERERDRAAIEARLADRAASQVSLQLIDAGGTRAPLQAGGTALRIGNTVRAVATSPPGWSRYLLVFGSEGPAELIDEATLARTDWAVPITGPGASQTVLLVTAARELSAEERRRLTDSIAAVAGPRVIDFDSHILWNDTSDRIESVATARGGRDTRWVEEVQTRIAALGAVRVSGRTFPIAAE